MLKNLSKKLFILLLILFCLLSFSETFALDNAKNIKNEEAIKTLNNLGVNTPNSQNVQKDIHDIKKLEKIKIKLSFKKIILIVSILSLLIIIITLLVIYFKKKNKKEEESYIPPPPFEIAKEKLRNLKKSNLNDKKFYFKLSFILREYIGNIWHFNAKEMTTEELLPTLRNLDIKQKLKSKTTIFLLESDRIKFANSFSTEERRNSDISFVENFIDETEKKDGIDNV